MINLLLYLRYARLIPDPASIVRNTTSWTASGSGYRTFRVLFKVYHRLGRKAIPGPASHAHSFTFQWCIQ